MEVYLENFPYFSGIYVRRRLGVHPADGFFSLISAKIQKFAVTPPP